MYFEVLFTYDSSSTIAGRCQFFAAIRSYLIIIILVKVVFAIGWFFELFCADFLSFDYFSSIIDWVFGYLATSILLIGYINFIEQYF